MQLEKSKIEGVGIIPLRCEICFGNIVDGEPVVALMKDNSMHFVHTTCYNDNDAEYILSRMNEISDKTKNDSELFNLMEGSNAKDTN